MRVTRQEAIENAKSMIAAYDAAELAVLNAQSYTIKGRTLTRAHLAEIQKARRHWIKKLAALQNARTGIRFGQVVPK